MRSINFVATLILKNVILTASFFYGRKCVSFYKFEFNFWHFFFSLLRSSEFFSFILRGLFMISDSIPAGGSSESSIRLSKHQINQLRRPKEKIYFALSAVIGAIIWVLFLLGLEGVLNLRQVNLET